MVDPLVEEAIAFKTDVTANGGVGIEYAVLEH